MRYQSGMKIRDDYTLEQLLGVGASGEVWKANDGYKSVAIKFMNENLLIGEKAEKHRQRLEREIHALGLLQHPNIPTLYDFDMDFERPFIVMEYISSPSYEHMLNTGEMLRTPVARRLEVLTDIADALTAAHDAGIIHRDIKPGNMNGVDKPYLLDFSIALEEENLEYTNFNVGTTIYMTPGGEAPDRLADNFSFAVVAYEVLFGEHPIFPRDDDTRNMGTYSRLVAFNRLKSGDWRMPSRLTAQQVPADLFGADFKSLDAIFNRAFGDRSQRYVQLGDFMADLSHAILTPENQAYATKNPVAPKAEVKFAPQPVQSANSFTVLEVESVRSDNPSSAPNAGVESQQGTIGIPSPTITDLPVSDNENMVTKIRKSISKIFGGK